MIDIRCFGDKQTGSLASGLSMPLESVVRQQTSLMNCERTCELA